MKFRPVAVPLITVDPYFSVWSCNDALYNAPTQHWSGRTCPIVAGVYVDGRFHSMIAHDENGMPLNNRIFQRDLQVTPTSSVYRFENSFVKVGK